MEYKIGQRVKFQENECYIAQLPDEDNLGHFVLVDNLGAISRYVWSTSNVEELSPLYKPGDKVRVKSRAELEKVYASLEFITKFAGTLQILKEINDDIGGQNRWNFVEGGESFVLAEDRFEWYSGVEDKPGDALIGVKRVDYSHVSESKPNGSPKIVEDKPEKFGIDELVAKNIDAFNSAEFNNCLIAEVHQDKDRNKAVMAEVLGHKPYYRIQYKCLRWEKDNCGFTGGQTEVQAHMKDFHEGESVPAFTSRFWDSLKVK